MRRFAAWHLLEKGSAMFHTASTVFSRPVSLLVVGALLGFLGACDRDAKGGVDDSEKSDSPSKKGSEDPGADSKDEGNKSGGSKSSGSKKKESPEKSEEAEDSWFKEPGVCGEGCNILDPKSCGDDERCVSWNCNLEPSPKQAWDDSNCRKIGKKQLLEECKRPWESSIENHCGKGMVCWSRCRETCTGSRDKPKCSNKKEACMLSNFGFVAACLPKCDPLEPVCEDDAQVCVPNGRLNSAFVCTPGGSEKLGKYGDPCETVNQCALGHYCIASRFVDHKKCEGDYCCTEYCDLKNKDKGCSQEGARCVPFFGSAAKAPKAYKRVGICSSL